MDEILNKAWLDYAVAMDMPDAVGFDYSRNAVEQAYRDGWKAHRELKNPPSKVTIKGDPNKYKNRRSQYV